MIRSTIVSLCWLIILSPFLFSCENKNQMSSENLNMDSLMIKYVALQDSVKSNWETMIADDDRKHVLMNRLLLEVSYTNNYDKDRFNELKAQIDQLKSMRYDQNSMKNSFLIDQYDSMTWNVSDQIIEFARSHPRYVDFPMMEELIQDINAKNNFILIHRIHYDNWVKELNLFSNDNEEQLKERNPDYKDGDMPLFQLPS